MYLELRNPSNPPYEKGMINEDIFNTSYGAKKIKKKKHKRAQQNKDLRLKNAQVLSESCEIKRTLRKLEFSFEHISRLDQTAFCPPQ